MGPGGTGPQANRWTWSVFTGQT